MKYIIEYKVEVGLDFKNNLLKLTKLSSRELLNYKILRESIDARDKTKVLYNYLLEIETTKKINPKLIRNIAKPYEIKYKQYRQKHRPVIVGFGPAGIFAALYLARCQAKPIIIERGDKVNIRQVKVRDFLENKILDENSNVVFGEGGAGTFSDGKLQTNLSSPYIKFILEEFVKHGANEDILTSNYPHIGTDILTKVIANIRQEIEKLGGSFYFNTTFIDYNKCDDIEVITDNGKFLTSHLILALGHSAYDTIKMLAKKGLKIEPKPFAIGVRIEHKQSMINKSQYGNYANLLPPANYKLVCHLKERSVFTFCMCPGGYVMPSQNEHNTIVTNGMSNNKREGENSNSALLVEVKVSDYYKGNPLDGFTFIKDIESKAFNIAKDYRAPANLVKEFLNDEVALEERTIKTTYPHKLIMTDLNKVLPSFVIKSLKEALPLLNNKLEGFSFADAIMIACETRSSCPVKFKRDNFMSSENGLYVIGEGSGYAGGITSSALDGLKCAISIINVEEKNEN